MSTTIICAGYGYNNNTIDVTSIVNTQYTDGLNTFFVTGWSSLQNIGPYGQYQDQHLVNDPASGYPKYLGIVWSNADDEYGCGICPLGSDNSIGIVIPPNSSQTGAGNSAPRIDKALIQRTFANLRADPAALEQFTNDPRPLLEAAGITVGDTLPNPEHDVKAVVRDSSYSCTINTKWWGLDIIMNEPLTQAIVSGNEGASALSGVIVAAMAQATLLTGGVAAVVGAAIAGAFVLKAVEIKLVDGGNGVHWPITWLQWAGFIAGVPLGPPVMLINAGLLFHPLPN